MHLAKLNTDANPQLAQGLRVSRCVMHETTCKPVLVCHGRRATPHVPCNTIHNTNTRVCSLPTVLMIHQGKLVDQFVGMQPPAQVEEFVTRAAKLSAAPTQETAESLYLKGAEVSACNHDQVLQQWRQHRRWRRA